MDRWTFSKWLEGEYDHTGKHRRPHATEYVGEHAREHHLADFEVVITPRMIRCSRLPGWLKRNAEKNKRKRDVNT